MCDESSQWDIAQLFLAKSFVKRVTLMKKSFSQLSSFWSEIHTGITQKNAIVTSYCPLSLLYSRTLPWDQPCDTVQTLLPMQRISIRKVTCNEFAIHLLEPNPDTQMLSHIGFNISHN